MRVPTLLTKFGAASVAGLLTLGGGLAFAEVGDPTSTDTVVDEGDTVTIPTDGAEEIPPVEDGGDVVVEEGGTEEGVPTGGEGEVIVVEEPEVIEVIEDPVVEEPVVKAHPENHGKYVSEAAKAAPKGKGGVHGKAVSQVARSNQGKKHAAGDGGEASASTATAKAGGKGNAKGKK